jgi:hypothetical protein
MDSPACVVCLLNNDAFDEFVAKQKLLLPSGYDYVAVCCGSRMIFTPVPPTPKAEILEHDISVETEEEFDLSGLIQEM